VDCGVRQLLVATRLAPRWRAACSEHSRRSGVRETESSLQQFAEFLLKQRLVQPKSAPFIVRWVRQFLAHPSEPGTLSDQVRAFCEGLERAGRWQDWQIRQAEQAVRLYFVNFLRRTDWATPSANRAADPDGRTDPLAALDALRKRLRTRHYSYRTECSYVDWCRRFLEYLAETDGPRPRVTAPLARNFLTHLAVQRRVSSSTQNQAQCAILFLGREVLSLDLEGLGQAPRAKRGVRLPVVLSVPETIAVLNGMHGTMRLMAALIYGSGLRVSECCQLRIKDLDFEQGLVFVRSGKGDKDRRTILPEACREALTLQLHAARAIHEADRRAGIAGVWMPDALARKYPHASREVGWFWVRWMHSVRR